MQANNQNPPSIQQLTLAESFAEMAVEQSKGLDDWIESERPTLESLVAQCDPNAPIPHDLIDWGNMPAVGNELR